MFDHGCAGTALEESEAADGWDELPFDVRQRYYDPKMGRFLSEDPSEYEGGDENLYRYVNNSPTNAVDPTGLKAVSGAGSLGAINGGIAGGLGATLHFSQSNEASGSGLNFTTGWESSLPSSVNLLPRMDSGYSIGPAIKLQQIVPMAAGGVMGAAGMLDTFFGVNDSSTRPFPSVGELPGVTVKPLHGGSLILTDDGSFVRMRLDPLRNEQREASFEHNLDRVLQSKEYMGDALARQVLEQFKTAMPEEGVRIVDAYRDPKIREAWNAMVGQPLHPTTEDAMNDLRRIRINQGQDAGPINIMYPSDIDLMLRDNFERNDHDRSGDEIVSRRANANLAFNLAMVYAGSRGTGARGTIEENFPRSEAPSAGRMSESVLTAEDFAASSSNAALLKTRLMLEEMNPRLAEQPLAQRVGITRSLFNENGFNAGGVKGVFGVREAYVTQRLQQNLNRAVRQFDAGGMNHLNPGLTAPQAAALKKNPELFDAFRGNRIDRAAFKLNANDPVLGPLFSNGQLRNIYRGGPDYVDNITGNWWDVTTSRQWQTHVDKWATGVGGGGSQGGTLLPTKQ